MDDLKAVPQTTFFLTPNHSEPKAMTDINTLTKMRDTFTATLLSRITECVEVAADEDNKYNINLIDVSDWDTAIFIGNERVTHFNAFVVIADDKEYGINTVINSHQQNTLCEIVDALYYLCVSDKLYEE